MENIKILFVGGTFDLQNGKSSGLVQKMIDEIKNINIDNYILSITSFNGGNYNNLENILNTSKEYDFVFWWANVDNSLPKIRDVKEVAPYTMLINSKRDDIDKYSFNELVQRSLAVKANLTFKFKKVEDKLFNITIFDPLGAVWYDGTNIQDAIKTSINRLIFLKSMTRQKTIKSDTSKGLVMSWYFDQFKQDEYQSDKIIDIPKENDFINTVKKYALQFQKFMPVNCKTERFIGNASLRPVPPQIGRCGKGMPSFRKDNMIFVSKRNIDKQFITLDNFVPVYMENNKLMYCGDEKPSVDTPVQIKLYEALPNINYILHSHCYIKNADYTHTAIPCGAIEEFDEITKIIKNKELNNYKINLKGHGSLIMWDNMENFHKNIEPNLEYIPRSLPEKMYDNNDKNINNNYDQEIDIERI